MKHTILTLSLLALSLGSAFAQTISAADKKAIDEIYATVAMAFQKSDPKIMEAMIAENAEQIIPTGEIIRGRANIVAGLAGYMAFLKSQPQPDRVEASRVNEQFRYLGADLVMDTYTEISVKHFGDKTETEKMTNAIIMRKTNGKWLTELIAIIPFAEGK
jgi:ketosteroid isomerase-like protein